MGATRRVVLVWLEPVSEGSAPRTHLEGTRLRLKQGGVDVVDEIYVESGGATTFQKARRIVGLIARARKASRATHGATLVARWHPFLAFVLRYWRRRGRVVLLVQGNDAALYESYPWFRRVPFARAVVTASLINADQILVLNEGVEAWVQRRLEASGVANIPVRVLPTGVAEVFLSNPTPAREFGEYAVFVGLLATWQGIGDLLAARDAPEWPAGLGLVVVGSGDQEIAVRAALDAGVVWVGRQPPARVAEILAGARLSVSPKLATPSMDEVTTPFKMLESAAVGVPVVASDISAQKRMLSKDPYGVLYPVGDVRALAAAVRDLATDDVLHAKSSEAARRVAMTLSWEYHLGILIAALDEQPDDSSASNS